MNCPREHDRTRGPTSHLPYSGVVEVEITHPTQTHTHTHTCACTHKHTSTPTSTSTLCLVAGDRAGPENMQVRELALLSPATALA